MARITLKSLVPEEMLVTRETPVMYKLMYSDNGLDMEKGMELAKSLMSKFQGVTCEPKNDLMMIMSCPDRASNVQNYLKQTGYKIAKPTLHDDVEMKEDIVNVQNISPSQKVHTKDIDLEKGKFDKTKWQKDNRL